MRGGGGCEERVGGCGECAEGGGAGRGGRTGGGRHSSCSVRVTKDSLGKFLTVNFGPFPSDRANAYKIKKIETQDQRQSDCMHAVVKSLLIGTDRKTECMHACMCIFRTMDAWAGWPASSQPQK
eukprot:COSAG01_NODE_19803_length_987_cov_1.890889_1_plen_124_part_00